MFFFAGIPFLFAGPVIGVICWLLALVLLVILYTPLRSWLGIAREEDSTGETGGQTTVVRVRDSKDVRLYDNIGVGTDSAVDAANVDGLDARGNRVLRWSRRATKSREDAG